MHTLRANMKSLKEIEYMYSKCSTEKINLIGELFSTAISASKQWKLEKCLGESTTECLTVLVPEGESEDISITLWVGRREGFRISDTLMLKPTWSIPPKRQAPPPHIQQEQDGWH